MTTVMLIAASVALLAIAAASLYCIILMKHARSFLTGIEGSVTETLENLLPLIENSGVITGKIRSLIEETDDEMSKLKGAADSLARAVKDLADLGKRIRTRVEGPAMNASGYLAASLKGLKAFMAFFQS